MARISVNQSPLLSIVVIGRNEGDRLVRCLRSVAAMAPLDGAIELIYVDSASTDGSTERAASLGARVISINPPRPCAAAGRNAGWKAASAPMVLFLDGDTVLDPGFVRQSLHYFDDPNVAVVWGVVRELNPRASVFNRVIDLDWIYPFGLSEFSGGNALIRRSVLETVGGFDEGLIAAEDTEMCWRIRALGYNILHPDRPMLAHDLAMTRCAQYWRRALRTGYALAEVSERLRHTSEPLWKRESRRNLFQGAGMLAVVAGAPVLALILRSFVPIAIAGIIIAALALRTAQRVKWKCPDFFTRLLYGLHSHL